ncbi:histone-lysine N-methyltransferase, H3 lysine-9 specific SUVH6 [Ziziphus jujuba]|uniref:Histone-lysine N-methyltransferase, H3 lysine-9 specific SUVH6 n=1 Tax=Ziziphus jujuba TaxID=326968 RepID=A0ABM3I3N4_ZIZJJ|nr:histone-lysine N-methyltransferase, H3 lysine-9 specific SUVH6 [Ziziphus jujuba]
MGVMEAMLHSDPLRTITLVNGSHSEERTRSFTMENGDCSLHDSPKYKRRKISAVRDFPPGCGRVAQRTCLRPTEDSTCTGTVENSICKGGSADRLNNESPDLPKDLHPLGVSTPRAGMVRVAENFFSPPERLTASFDGSGLKKSDRLKNESLGLPEDLHPLGVSTPPNETVSLATENLFSPPERSITAFDVSGLKKSDRLKIASPDLPKDLHPVDISVQKEDKVPVLKDDLFSPPERLISVLDGSGLKSSKARKYCPPQRRKVSAIRTFPPLCGPNAPHVSKEESSTPTNNDFVEEKSECRMADKMSADTVNNNVKQTAEDVQGGDSYKTELGEKDSEVIGDKVQPEFDGHNAEEMGNQVDHGMLSARTVEREHKKEDCTEPPFDSKLFWWDHEFETVVENSNDDECPKENLGKEIVVYSEEKALDENVDVSGYQNQLQAVDYENLELKEKCVNRKISDLSGQNQLQVVDTEDLELQDKILNEKISDMSGCHNQLQVVDFGGLECSSGRVVVHGLMAASNCPWRLGKVAYKSKQAAGISGNEGKKLDHISQVERPKTSTRKKDDKNGFLEKSLKKIPTVTEKDAFQHTGQLVVWDMKDSLQHDDEYKNIHVAKRSCGFDVCVPPVAPGSSRSKGHGIDSIVTRNKVRETLRLFQAICRKLLQDEESKSKEGRDGKNIKRVDCGAAKILKDKNKYLNTGKQIVGAVPGVEVGDEFQYRVELNIIGLHRQNQGGIDYFKQGGKVLATSVVASGGYDDDLDNSDVLIYTGQGGNVMNSDKKPEDQKLERGNLALKNSVLEKNPVRVIRRSESLDGKSKTYVYDGLYLVEKCWQDLGPHGKLVFKFQLERIPGQPELAWKEVKKSKKYRIREGLCVDDISGGKERIPICAVNTLDDEKPPAFVYITSIIYPTWYRPVPPRGCDCVAKCTDSERCSCAVRNGGEIPYNYNGAIVEAKSLVYECGPSCKCPPSCHNRVSQHGIKFQLEIFKTETRGWGVRSLNSISSGSFICEYIGELLEEKDADAKTSNDEYLFDIGNNYNDCSLWGELSSFGPDAQPSPCELVEDGSFTIDAAQFGNVGRFINHSCTPNLYAQNVLYDHDDKRIPHIMLFAAENIPPLQELTYHYNYMIDQVRDSNGNIKKKSCYCGSLECTGRMY